MDGGTLALRPMRGLVALSALLSTTHALQPAVGTSRRALPAARLRMYEADWEGCLVPEFEPTANTPLQADELSDPTSAALTLAPIVIPIFAAAFFGSEVDAVHDMLAFGLKWFEVDGGLSRTAALLPLLTGIVLPCVSFALGTLTATTISTLRERQVTLRKGLNAEACLIRSVLSATESMFSREHSPCERDRK
jgi:hypothetical protein